jgi:tuftelin-interacting protein 11
MKRSYEEEDTRPSFATMNSKNEMQPDWEKSTKGIGSKLLKQMGWQPGHGLGIEKKGISRPIEVKLRPKNRGLGYDFDERTQQQKEDFPTEGDQKENLIPSDESEQTVYIPGWKRGSKKKIKREKEIEVIVEESKPSEILTPKVFDYTGEVPRMVENYNALTSQQVSTGNSAFLPEIQHNLRLLVDLREGNLVNLERKRSSNKLRLSQHDELRNDLREKSDRITLKLSRLRLLYSTLGECQQQIKDYHMDMVGLAKKFQALKKEFSVEYADLQLGMLASSLALPLLKPVVNEWDPFQNPVPPGGLECFRQWAKLMGTTSTSIKINPPSNLNNSNNTSEGQAYESTNNNNIETVEDETEWVLQHKFGHKFKEGITSAELDTYSQLLCDLLLPKLRSAALRSWPTNVCYPEPFLLFLETWQTLLPPALRDNVIDQLIFPQLTRALDQWNPLTLFSSRIDAASALYTTSINITTNTTTNTSIPPPHSWLLQWAPWLGSRMDNLWIPLRQKLGVVLSLWKLSGLNSQAAEEEGEPEFSQRILALVQLQQVMYPLFSPWKNIFGLKHWETIVKRQLMPNVVRILQYFVIHTASKDEVLLSLVDVILSWKTFFSSFVPPRFRDPFYHLFVSTFLTHLFPHWHSMLISWVQQRSVDWSQVAEWYERWRNEFAALLQLNNRGDNNHPFFNMDGQAEDEDAIMEDIHLRDRLELQFEYALSVMNAGVEGMTIPVPPVGVLISSTSTNDGPQHSVQGRDKQRSDSSVEFSFREALSKLAENYGLFLMATSRRHEGKTVYEVDGVSIYIEKGVVFRNSKGKWLPTDFGLLLEELSHKGSETNKNEVD